MLSKQQVTFSQAYFSSHKVLSFICSISSHKSGNHETQKSLFIISKRGPEEILQIHLNLIS